MSDITETDFTPENVDDYLEHGPGDWAIKMATVRQWARRKRKPADPEPAPANGQKVPVTQKKSRLRRKKADDE